MLRFFRQIRQRLLTENRFTKYLLYAVGEILLVVIGILIALQVNNNNQQRIANKELETGLRNLLVEIENNLYYVDRAMSAFDSDNRNLESYIRILNSEDTSTIRDSVIHGMIDNLYSRRILDLEENAYHNLINSGMINYIDKDLNDSLKKNILGMENGFNMHKEYKDKVGSHWENDLRPFLYKEANFIDISAFKEDSKKVLNKSYYPLNLNSFIGNREFTNLLLIRLSINRGTKNRFEFMSNRFEMIHSEIKKYLEAN